MRIRGERSGRGKRDPGRAQRTGKAGSGASEATGKRSGYPLPAWATNWLGVVTDELKVVTVTYSPGPHLDRFLASLAHATNRPVTVIMADNGSTDGAPEE